MSIQLRNPARKTVSANLLQTTSVEECGSHGLSRLSRWRRHYSETLENAYRLPAPGREQVPAWGQRCCSMLWRKNILHCLQLRGHGADRRRAVCVHR